MTARRSLLSAALAVLLGAVPFAAVPARAEAPFITVASTTSTEQSGLFGHLLPAFTKATGIEVRVVAVSWHVLEGRADLFLAYCTAGREAAAEAPGLTVVELPPELAVGAEYGLTVLRTANPQTALLLVLYILSAEGQATLARHGFDAPLSPR